MIVEMDLTSQNSIAMAFERIRREAGDPQVAVYNAGYTEGRTLPKEQEFLEFFPVKCSTRPCKSRLGTLPCGQGSSPGDAQERKRIVLLLE